MQVGPLPSIEKRRRLPLNLDHVAGEAAKRRQRRLPRTEFTKRVRFRDRTGYQYALPSRLDPLYNQYLKNGLIDALPTPASGSADDNRPLVGARALLYVSKPRTRALVRIPLPGTHVRLLDMLSKQVLEVRVLAFFIQGRERSGHAVVEVLVNHGAVLDISEFPPIKGGGGGAARNRK